MSDEIERKEKEEVIGLLKEQIEIEGKLVGLYEKPTGEI